MAIIFEVDPSRLPLIGFETVESQLELLHRIWEFRESVNNNKKQVSFSRGNLGNPEKKTINSKGLSPLEWECTLGSLVVGRTVHNNLVAKLRI